MPRKSTSLPPALRDWWHDIRETFALLARILPFLLLVPLFFAFRAWLGLEMSWSGELILGLFSALFAYFLGDFYRQERRRTTQRVQEALDILSQKGLWGLFSYLEKHQSEDPLLFNRVLQEIPNPSPGLEAVGKALLGAQYDCNSLTKDGLSFWEKIIDPVYQRRLLKALLKCGNEHSDRLEKLFNDTIIKFAYQHSVPIFGDSSPYWDSKGKSEYIHQRDKQAGGSQLLPLNPHAEFAFTVRHQIASPLLAAHKPQIIEQIINKRKAPILICVGEEGVGRTTLALYFASFSHPDLRVYGHITEAKEIVSLPEQIPVYVALHQVKTEEERYPIVLPLMYQAARVTFSIMLFFLPAWKREWFAFPEWRYVALLFRFFKSDLQDLYDYLRGSLFREIEEVRLFLDTVQKYTPLFSVHDLLRNWPAIRISTERFLARLPHLWLADDVQKRVRTANGNTPRQGYRTRQQAVAAPECDRTANGNTAHFHFFVDFQWAPREEFLRKFLEELHLFNFEPVTLFLPDTHLSMFEQDWIKIKWDDDKLLSSLLQQLGIDIYSWVEVDSEDDLEKLVIKASKNNPQKMLHLLARIQMEAHLRGGEIPEDVFREIIRTEDGTS